jgi:hypothetical protein
MPGGDVKIKLTKEQLLDTLCKMCTHPDAPKMCCRERSEGTYCAKVIKIGGEVCKKTSLENDVIFKGY